MAVIDKTNKMKIKEISVYEKLQTITEYMFLSGKPSLRGNFLIRLIDTLRLKMFGLLFSFGEKADGIENEYYRLTKNFKRIGNIARKFKFLGPLNRILMRIMMKTNVCMLGRQQLFGLTNTELTLHGAALGYFTAADYFDFKIEIDSVNNDRVIFRFIECPVGYKQGDDMKLCMATNKFDRQCVRMMGARLIIQELIPEGASACMCHIVPKTGKVLPLWRRYPRFWI